MVRAGTSRGSLPQEDEVVMPPVALSETEQGMPRKFSAGSFSPPDEFPALGGTPGAVAIGPGAVAAEIAVCACVDSKLARRRMIVRTNMRTTALSR